MYLIKKINSHAKKIFSFIDKNLKKYQGPFLQYSNDKLEFFELYKDFLQRGKGIRGALVFLTNEIFNQNKIVDKKNLYYLASFFELMHSSLLIHDDIMDKDQLRRGKKTINFHFENKYKNNSLNPSHLGNSLAINVGDFGFFIAFDFFNEINIDYYSKKFLFNLLTYEYIKVALAQTDDVLFSQTNFEPDLETIKKIYLNKTARYTLNLPILSTLYISKNQYFKNKILNSILENLGLLFQITDDLIGFLSDETGKDFGSDIRENKKTIVRYFLYQEQKKSPLKKLFGKKNLKKDEIEKIRNFYHNSITKEKINQLINQIKEKIIADLKKNQLPKEFKILTLSFIDYLIQRKK
jgi:geranylgeranyl diphosphate synthase type I